MKNNTAEIIEVNAKNNVITTDEKTVEKEIKKLKNMSIREIDNYGCQIQKMINDKSCELLEKTNMSEIPGVRTGLEELQEVASKQKKMLPVLSTPLRKLKRFQSGFEKIQTKIDNITTSLEQQKITLDNHIEFMMEQADNIKSASDELKIKEDCLQAYADALEVENNPDQVRFQAVTNRLHLLSGSRVAAEQAQIEAYMIIKAQQESKYQLDKIVQNVVPILRAQAVNAVGIRVNKETLEIMAKTREVAGKIVEQTAKDVRDMAEELQNNRTRGVVDDEKLANAQAILNEAMETVAKASQVEAQTNLRLTRELREQAAENQKFIDKLRQM